MNCLCEALGMALPGNGTVLAVSKEREALYRQAACQDYEVSGDGFETQGYRDAGSF